MKIGRNEPCWCGSGKKFKRCHMHRASEEPLPLSTGVEALRHSKRSRGCNSPATLHGECSGDVIGSHSISKSLGLKALSVNNHILTLRHDFSTLKRTGGIAEIGEVSINKMSVFPGFCAHHDKTLFATIEDANFESSLHQCALLSYRALAREKHAKLGGIDVNDFLKDADKGKHPAQQLAMQTLLSGYGTGLDLAMEDLDRGLMHHHEAVVSGDYTRFESLIIEFSTEFPLLCSTGHMPSEDWEGAIIQDLLDPKLKADWLTAVAFQSNGSAWVVFTWLRGKSKIRDAVGSLLEAFPGTEADALIKYFFSISENFALSPNWWNEIGDVQRRALNSRIMDGTPINGGENIVRPKKDEPKVISLPILSLRWI